MWQQGWMSSEQLELSGDQANRWTLFISELCNGHIKLKDEPNCLIWNQNKVGGFYSAKLEYEVLMKEDGMDECWWWCQLWKVKAPKTTQIFMWLALLSKVPTWDYLQKKQKHGPGVCYLC